MCQYEMLSYSLRLHPISVGRNTLCKMYEKKNFGTARNVGKTDQTFKQAQDWNRVIFPINLSHVTFTLFHYIHYTILFTWQSGIYNYMYIYIYNKYSWTLRHSISAIDHASFDGAV